MQIADRIDRAKEIVGTISLKSATERFINTTMQNSKKNS